MDQQKITKIASIVIGTILAIALVIVGFKIVQGRLGRAESTTASSVSVTNVTENSATVTFTTGAEAECAVNYGTTPSSMTFFSDAGSGASHNAQLTLLSGNTTYYFAVDCGGNITTSTGTASSGQDVGTPFSFETSGPVAPTAMPASPTPTPAPASPTPEESDVDCTDATVLSEYLNENSIDTVGCLDVCSAIQCAAASQVE